jgi:hypothetical protein
MATIKSFVIAVGIVAIPCLLIAQLVAVVIGL